MATLFLLSLRVFLCSPPLLSDFEANFTLMQTHPRREYHCELAGDRTLSGNAMLIQIQILILILILILVRSLLVLVLVLVLGGSTSSLIRKNALFVLYNNACKFEHVFRVLCRHFHALSCLSCFPQICSWYLPVLSPYCRWRAEGR
jgi:hypothetical protein